MYNIVHLIQYDSKFIDSYISFFSDELIDYKHTFVIFNRNDTEAIVSENYNKNNNIFRLTQIDKNKVHELLKNSDKIVVSGIFDIKSIISVINKKYRSKVYLHFWGGDYTQYRKCKNIKLIIKKIIIKNVIKDCRCVLNLLDGEYVQFKKVFNLTVRHAVARFPNSSKRIRDFTKYTKEYSRDDKNIIIVGNSATETNRHIEVFYLLKKFVNEDIEIHCPLAYGDEDYRNKVIIEGKKIFGNKFFPHLELQPYEEYLKFLASCKIGVFNNDRQQALGNMNLLLRMGKKLYIRKDTPQWNSYLNNNVIVFDVTSLQSLSYEEFMSFDSKIKVQNLNNTSPEASVLAAKKEWTNVLSE